MHGAGSKKFMGLRWKTEVLRLQVGQVYPFTVGVLPAIVGSRERIQTPEGGKGQKY